LISEFKTKNGRTVKDGGGITPDVEVLPETLSQLTTELYLRNFIFDFATQYYWSHPEIKNPEQFIFTEKDFADFTKYIKDKSFNYKTITEQSFNELVANAKREKYYDIHKDLFTELEKDITHDLEEDLKTFKSEITELLSDEIIGRYFYEDGAIKWTLKTDEQILKAIKVLDNKDQYSLILNGKSGSILVTSKNNNGMAAGLAERRSGSRII
jgi:carboxyl-terminal processing protease